MQTTASCPAGLACQHRSRRACPWCGRNAARPKRRPLPPDPTAQPIYPDGHNSVSFVERNLRGMR